MSKRLKAMGNRRYADGFKVTLHDDVVEVPLRWRLPRIIFVNSMSDMFHDAVPSLFIARCFDVMRRASQHTFQILTKRPDRVIQLSKRLPWPRNVWMGVSVENQDYVWRIDELRRIPAAVRFLSIEPLLGPITDLSLKDINWAIVGGESGPGARPMHADWVRNIRQRCEAEGVAFFFKQWGGVQKSKTGRVLDDRTWDEMPSMV